MLRLLAIVFFFLPSITFAQVGKDLNLWQWTQPASHHKAIVEIKGKSDNREISGTCIVIGEFRVITARHVIEDGFSYYINVDGKDINLSMTHSDTIADICILNSTQKIQLPIIKIADNIPRESEKVEVCGFGGGGPLRHFSGELKLYSGMFIGVDAYVIPGDSGGAILNSEKELIGIISGGMAWSSEKKIKHEDNEISVTWPIRCGSLDLIKEMVKR